MVSDLLLVVGDAIFYSQQALSLEQLLLVNIVEH